LANCSRDYFALERADSGINKVLFVPKDSRGPRTIACEPSEYQFIQQGLRKELYPYIENHKLTKGKINFTDQTINQNLAYKASLPGSDLVTLDMKDASDSVSVLLVSKLFEKTEILRALLALRTPVSRLPSGTLVTLKKYASMGSALCFPVEALVFYSLIYGLACVLGDSKPIIYVYGDDIIVRRSYYEPMLKIFSELGLKINEEKSCTTGLFRESCGKDFYDGHEVTYVKMRRRDVRDPDEIVSLTETSNLLWERGYYNAAKSISNAVKAKIMIPYGYKDSPYLSFYNSRFPGRPPEKAETFWNKNLQRNEIKRPVLKGVVYRITNDKHQIKGTLPVVYNEYFRKVTTGWSPEFRAGSYARRHSIKIIRKRIDALI
jgi:hypothetical protein